MLSDAVGSTESIATNAFNIMLQIYDSWIKYTLKLKSNNNNNSEAKLAGHLFQSHVRRT